MNSIKSVAPAMLLVLAGGFAAAQAQEHPGRTEHPTKEEHPAKVEHAEKAGDIVSVAAAAGGFNTFLQALEAAGLVEKFQGKGPFTVFAPTDEAFAKLPAGTIEDLLKPANKARLAGLLANHVVPGVIMAENVKTMKATNVSGQDLHLKIDEGTVCVNNARVVQPDLVAANGVIHAVDSVVETGPPAKKAESGKPKDHPAH